MKKIMAILIVIFVVGIFGLSFIEIDKSFEGKEDKNVIYSIDNISKDLKNISELSQEEQDIICATSKGLVEKNIDGKIMPSLAEEVNTKDEGTEYEFIIKDNIKFSNGENITAKDIKEFMKELIEEDENNEFLLNIYGVKNYLLGKVNFEDGVAITTTDNSIKIRLNKADDNFLEELTKPKYRIRRSLAKWENIKENYKDILYSGDYKIVYVDDDKIELKRENENWKLVFVKNENKELAMASFEIGDIDIVKDPPRTEVKRLEAQEKVISLSSNNGLYAFFNNNNKESLSLKNRKEIYKNIYYATNDYEADNINFIEGAEGSYFREDKDDLEKMQNRKVIISSILEESDLESISILAIDNEFNRDYCKYLKEWTLNNNLKLNYKLISYQELWETNLDSRYDLVLLNLNSSIDNKDNYYNMIYKYCNNLFNNKDIKINFNTMDYVTLENELFNNYEVLPVLYEKSNIAVSEKIENLKYDGNGNIDFSRIVKNNS